MGSVARGIGEALAPIGRQAVEAAPRLAAALLLLLVGWLIAKALRKGATRLLKLARVDVMAERSGFEDFLVQGGVRYTTVTLIASGLYWSVLGVVVLSVLNVLGLGAAALLVQRIILYLPNVLVAIIVLVFGTVISRFVSSLLLAYLTNVGVQGAEILSGVAHYAILIFVISVALEHLAIGGQILVSAFQIAFGGLCLALALAFGLGGREWAAHTLSRMWKG